MYALPGHNSTSLLARYRTVTSSAWFRVTSANSYISLAQLQFPSAWDTVTNAHKRACGSRTDKADWTGTVYRQPQAPSLITTPDVSDRGSGCKISGHQVLDGSRSVIDRERQRHASDAPRWWTAWDGSDKSLDVTDDTRAPASSRAPLLYRFIHTQTEKWYNHTGLFRAQVYASSTVKGVQRLCPRQLVCFGWRS